MNDPQGYYADITQRLQTWRTRLREIQGQTDRVAAQHRLEFHRQLDLLEAKLDTAALKLRQMQTLSGLEWQDLKASLDGVCNEIENALDSAWAKIGG